MSTPTGKPLNPDNPTDTFADVSDETWERAGPEQQHSEDDNDPLRSPYAPKKARMRPSSVEPDSVTSEDAAPLAPLGGPEGFREHSAVRRRAVEADGSRRYSDDAADHALAPAMPSSQERNDHSRMSLFEDAFTSRHLVDPDVPLQPAHPNSRRLEPPAAA